MESLSYKVRRVRALNSLGRHDIIKTSLPQTNDKTNDEGPGGTRSKRVESLAVEQQDRHCIEQKWIVGHSGIVVEIRTSLMIHNDTAYLAILAQRLAECFSRDQSSMTVVLDHSVRMMFNGTSDPAYVATVTALPSELVPAMTKQYAVTISGILLEVLTLKCARGVIRFVPAHPEHIAFNGITMFSKLQQHARHLADEASRKRAMPSPSSDGNLQSKGVEAEREKEIKYKKGTHRLNRMKSLGELLRRKP